jgi:hypothetical protein
MKQARHALSIIPPAPPSNEWSRMKFLAHLPGWLVKPLVQRYVNRHNAG